VLQAFGEEEARWTLEKETRVEQQAVLDLARKSQEYHSAGLSDRCISTHGCSTMSIEQAIQEYLEAQRKSQRRPKTLKWHQTALSLFQRYLLDERQCVLLNQISEPEIHGWLIFLSQTPLSTGIKRSAGTVESYSRSVHVFCQWLTRHQYLERTPFVPTLLPKVSPSLVHLLEPEEWELLLLACHPFGTRDTSAEQAAARNRVILWILMEMGMRVWELCALRLGDVDRVQGRIRVRGKDQGTGSLP
jgi:site-specific recombinase XerD